MIATVLDEANGIAPVVAGTGSISTKETILLAEDAKDLGVDAALVVTPFYFKLSNKEIHDHYKALLDAVDLPIILYNVPKFTGRFLDPTVISQLASEYENVVGIKESGGSIGTITEIIRLVGDKISVLAGTADVVLSTLILGGNGAVAAVANVFPNICSSLYEAFIRGDYEKAGVLQRRISYLNEVLVKRQSQISVIKAALSLKGLPCGYPRAPSLPLEGKEKETIESLMKSELDPSLEAR